MTSDPADVIPSPLDDEDEEGRQDPSTQRVLVVGAGPSGLLTSLYLNRRGYQVHIIDKQADSQQGHNFPLVLSSRALIAFRELGLSNISFYNSSTAQPFLGEIHLGSPSSPSLTQIPSASPSPGVMDRPNSKSLVDYHTLVRELEGCVLSSNKINMTRGVELTKLDLLQSKAQLISRITGEEVDASFDLVCGADGSDSVVRRAMSKAKRGNLDEALEAQVHSVDMRTFKSFSSLPQSAEQDLLKPFQTSAGSHLFKLSPTRSGAPMFEFWVTSASTVDGIIIAGPDYSWEKAELESILRSDSYPWSIPEAWIGKIVDQVCGPGSKLEPRALGKNIQCSQYHGVASVLMGDAAHSLTTESRQGMNLSVESIRLFNSVLKISGSLKRAGEVFTEVRREDAHSLHTVEGMLRANADFNSLRFSEWGHRLAAMLSRVILAAATLGCSLLSNVFPNRFKPDWIQSSLDDCRKGYSDGVLKILTRFAALPILLAILFATVMFWKQLVAMVSV
jgi:2-polyprenyl-6-methoxyphenol hydroxylase-like FAD-dependent oxidoreductase